LTRAALASDPARMEIPVNLAVFEGVTRALGNWRPGVLRVEADGLAFLQRGSATAETISTGEIASVSITTHFIGGDDVVIGLRTGGSWSLKVSGGERIVEVLRKRGIVLRA
jgi:hypothetical protein